MSEYAAAFNKSQETSGLGRACEELADAVKDLVTLTLEGFA